MMKHIVLTAALLCNTLFAMTSYHKPSDLKKKLTTLQYEVTQNDATEPPFQNAYWDNHEEGIYVDVTTGEPLFNSRDKFDSGTGWPSFTKPIDRVHVVTREDKTLGRTRTEVRSKAGDAHLGHVFDDGPKPTGQRFCINSASLRFIPASKLKAEGYGEYAVLFKDTAKPLPAATNNVCAIPKKGEAAGCAATLEVAVLAGGCFWGMEDILRKIPGVVETEVGYTGGTTTNPTYEQVHAGKTGHAEAVRIIFDPSKLSYEDLLAKWFFKMHDSTTLNRQGNDIGTSYRSAIFYTSDAQKKTAERVKARVKGAVTEVTKAGEFARAEEEHQDYLQKHPDGYTCHYMRK